MSLEALSVHRAHAAAGVEILERLADRSSGEVESSVLEAAREIVLRIRKGGDAALCEAVRRYDDGEAVVAADLRVDLGEPAIPAELEDAFEGALEAIEAYHRQQRPHVFELVRGGVRLEERVHPLHRVGIYVPGGRFPYPSTAMMTVVPARIAGVAEIAVVSPPGALRESVELRWILRRLGVSEVWGMGGAHAVAALAHGTETVPRVDRIVGPGNAWVAAAKQLVSGTVGVDQEAGPSEVVIVASADAPVELVAADLLAQAEHDPLAMSVLLTDDEALARGVAASMVEQAEDLATRSTIAAALRERGGALVFEDLGSALEAAERLAPEHLQLIGRDAESYEDRVRCAGAVFVGATTPVVFGDYAAGPSHVLPTAGTARFSGGLSVDDFVRRTHHVAVSEAAADALAAVAETLATVEGLEAHARAARLRRTS